MEATVQVLAERLGTMPTLAGLPDRCREALAEVGSVCTFGRDEEILTEGDPSESIFLVLRGRVKMVRATPVGRNVILALFGPGEVFGAVAALATQKSEASMTALEETQCLEIHRSQLFGLFHSHPELVEELLPLLTRQLAECKNCMVEMTGYRVEVRFAHLFLKLGDRIGYAEDGGVFLPIRLSRQDLADMTGTTIETCIRLMSRWGREGLVETRSEGFLICDHGILEAISHG